MSILGVSAFHHDISYLAIPNKINSIRLNKLKKRETDSWRPWAPVCLESLSQRQL